MAKVQVEALKRGTKVSPSTGQPVHFNPAAKRSPLAKRPLVDVRDVDHFVDMGMCKPPKANAREIGLEEERRLIAEATAALRRGRGGGALAAARVAEAAAIDDAAGRSTTGLDTRQARTFDPASDVDQNLGEGDGEGEGGDEGDADGAGSDAEAPPPAAAPAKKPPAKKPS